MTSFDQTKHSTTLYKEQNRPPTQKKGKLKIIGKTIERTGG